MVEPRPRAGLIVASNRLPFVLTRGEDGRLKSVPGSGGLVTALVPVLRDRGGTWVGWPGIAGYREDLQAHLAEATEKSGYRLKPVLMSEEERHKFYHGFANEIVWPLFHDLPTFCNFLDPSYWRAYLNVNRKFAQVIAEDSRREDFIWVQDYHLMTVAMELRKLDVASRIGFFLHIPFPPLDIYVKLPWRFQLLRALLDYDVIGLQTLRDRRNFIQCVRTLIPDVEITGKGSVLTVKIPGREVRVGVFPISIDYNTHVKHAAAEPVHAEVERLRAALPNRQLLLGVDRLDYTKGIPHRLAAFRHALTRYPELHEKVTLIQVVVPSREDIPRYHELKVEIEHLVGEINGQFTRPGGWVPIHYVFRRLTRVELLAYYRAAQIALVTPLKDGMNLVAKEYCTCSLEEDCVLILSEFAGAAAQLQRGALLVNPYDVEGVADAIYRAYSMPLEERRLRMRRLRRSIRRNDIFWWANSFLKAAIARDLSAFPLPEDYIPRTDLGQMSDLAEA